MKHEIEEKCKVQIEIDSQNGNAVVSLSSEPLSEMQTFQGDRSNLSNFKGIFSAASLPAIK